MHRMRHCNQQLNMHSIYDEDYIQPVILMHNLNTFYHIISVIMSKWTEGADKKYQPDPSAMMKRVWTHMFK